MALEKKIIPSKKKSKTLLYTVGVLALSTLGLALQIKWDQNHIVVDQFAIHSSKIPSAFDGYKIVHLSDLHGVAFKDGQVTLLKKIMAEKPNLIVVSGDTLDKHLDHWQNSIELLTELSRSTPVYISTGNHEFWTPHREEALKTIEKTGAILLDNEVTFIKPKDSPSADEDARIWLCGINDPWFFDQNQDYLNVLSGMKQVVNQNGGKKDFVMLLSHRPELQSLYATYGYDLTFAGHAHGGQVRLPFTEGLIAPHQGLMPKLTAGLHDLDGHYLLISRGLGNPKGFPRVFNPPEVVSLTLHSTVK